MSRTYQQQYANIISKLINNPKKIGKSRIGDINSRFSEQMRIDLTNEFPLQDIKKIKPSNIIHELIWMLRGDTNIKYLIENGCNIWTDDYKRWNRDKNIDDGDLGFIYGHQWRKFGADVDKITQPKPNVELENFEKLEVNIENKKSKYVGKIFETKNNGKYQVIDYSKEDKFKIQFLDTNTVLNNISSNHMNNDEVKDPYKINVYGVGCVGINNNKLDSNIRRKLYITWRNMLSRCYDINHIAYKNYGGKGVHVNNRWLCFEYFIDDVIKLKNWKQKLKNWKKYQLDKDYVGNGFKYSKDTCVWLDSKKNNELNKETLYTFFNRKTNELYSTKSIRSFGKKINAPDSFDKYGYKLVNGELEVYRDWTLIEKTDLKNKGTDQLSNVIDTLKSNPDDRRMIVIAHNPYDIEQGLVGLPSCHNYFQFYTTILSKEDRSNLALKKHGLKIIDEKELDELKIPTRVLCTFVNIRSNDFFLGNPYNTAQYALLTHIIANIVDMEVGELVINMVDCHLYHKHFNAANEWLDRFEKISNDNYVGEQGVNVDFFKVFGCKAELVIKRKLDNIDDITIDDFEFVNYNPQGFIKAPLLT